MLKAIIFDMDGVIIDSEPQHARAALLAVKKYGVKNISESFFYRFIGSTTYYMCQCIIKEFYLNVTPEQLLKDNNYYKKELASTEGYHPVPYVINLIKHLHKNGMRLIIASSSSPQEIEEVLNSLQLNDYFEGYISGSQVKHPKPAPDIFLKALERLQLEASECMVIEDSKNGCIAAKEAGIACIGYSDPDAIKQDLSDASMIVEGFDELDYSFVVDIYNLIHHLPRTIAITDRLYIREYQASDWEDYHAIVTLFKKEENYQYYGVFFHSMEEFKSYIEYNYQFYGIGNWGVFLPSGELIGQCGITQQRIGEADEYTLGFFMSPNHQRCGYIREAIKAVLSYVSSSYEIQNVVAVTHYKNRPSQSCIESLGLSMHKENQGDNILYYINI